MRIVLPDSLGGAEMTRILSDNNSRIFYGPLIRHPWRVEGGNRPIRKIPVSVKFVSAILGPEMGAPILWTPGKMRSFCRKNPCP